ncbi:MAG: type II secretion system protein N [Halioglobus sp.]
MNLVARYQGLSDPLRTERRVELAVLVLMVLLLLQLLWGAYRAASPAIPEPVRPARDSLAVIDISGLAVVSPEQRAQIRQRPLFWATRAPVQPPEAVKPEAAEPKAPKAGKIDNVKLSGVFGAGDATGIIVVTKGKKHRVMLGEEIQGWTLQSVDPTSAELTTNGKLATLALQRTEILSQQAEDDQTEKGKAAGRQGQKKKTAAGQKKKPVKKKTVPEGLGLGGGDRAN